MAKKEKTNKEYDLSEPIIGFDGEPEIEQQQIRYAVFDKPIKIDYTQQGIKKSGEFAGGVLNVSKLTFRKLLFQAVRGQKDGENVPSIDRRTEIMFKLVNDRVELDTEEKSDIIKCVRSLGDALYMMRVKEFFG